MLVFYLITLPELSIMIHYEAIFVCLTVSIMDKLLNPVKGLKESIC